MVFRLPRKAQPAGALQRRFSQSIQKDLVFTRPVISVSATYTENACLAEFVTGSETRPTDPDYAQGYKVMFADAFPILIASQSQVVFRVFQWFPRQILSANVVTIL